MIDYIIEYCEISEPEKIFIGEKYNECLIGISHIVNEDFSPVYNLNKVIEIIMNDNKLNESDSIEYFNKNILDKFSSVSFLYFINGDRDNLSNYNINMLFLDGYSDDCLLGVRFKQNSEIVAAYDDSACIQNLISDGMTEEDAFEYFEYNTRGAYYNNNTPAIITLF
jgi:hypothetical protein